jgi:hypothetical protein
MQIYFSLSAWIFYLHRLVMYLERDSRRQTPRDTKVDPAEMEYLNRCLDLLINYISDSVPNIIGNLLLPGKKEKTFLFLYHLLQFVSDVVCKMIRS